MAQAPDKVEQLGTSKQEKPSAQESLRRMAIFEQRKEKFVAAIRKSKN